MARVVKVARVVQLADQAAAQRQPAGRLRTVRHIPADGQSDFVAVLHGFCAAEIEQQPVLAQRHHALDAVNAVCVLHAHQPCLFQRADVSRHRAAGKPQQSGQFPCAQRAAHRNQPQQLHALCVAQRFAQRLHFVIADLLHPARLP